MSRFNTMTFAALAAAGVALGIAAEPAKPREGWKVLDPAVDPEPHSMLSGYLQRIAAAQLADRDREVAAVRDRAQFEQRRDRMRQSLLRMIGGLDEEKTPLNLRRTGTLERDGYRIEKIIYESRPNFYVTANLYIPTRGQAPFPAVLQPLGHNDLAKAGPTYQTMSIGLVRHGFVVLTYDPIGQGERKVYWDADIQDSKVGRSTREHTMLGFQSLPAGESVARYRIWDGLRSIDLLESLPEVDAKRIGITGCSGGGTLTTYIAALDPRIQVAAPACYMCSWHEQLLGKGPQDGEQQFPDQLKEGFDHADFIWLTAPKPYLICSTDQDPSFPLAGARRTYNEARRIYRLLGAEEKVRWQREPGPHGIPKASREVMYGWMKRWLQGAPDGPAAEGPIQLEHVEDLNATPTGQVSTSLGGETASTWNMKRFSAISPPRPKLETRADLEKWRGRVRDEVKQLTRYMLASAPLNVRSRGTIQREGYRAERLVFQSDEGLLVPGVLCQPDKRRSPAPVIVLVDQRGKSAALAPGSDAEQLVRLGYIVFAIDPAGIGETAFAQNPSADWYPFGTAWTALMVGKPMVGIRMNDMVRALDVLAEKKLLHDGAMGYARGRIGVELLHAAALDPRFSGVIVEEGLVSYESIARTPIHHDIYELTLPGVLRKYDLPDLVAALAPRPVWLVNLLSPVNRPVLRREVESIYSYSAAAYATLGSAWNLRIRLRRETDTIADAFPEL